MSERDGKLFVLIVRDGATGEVTYYGPLRSEWTIEQTLKRHTNDYTELVPLTSAYRRVKHRTYNNTAVHDEADPSQQCYRRGCRETSCREAHRVWSIEHRITNPSSTLSQRVSAMVTVGKTTAEIMAATGLDYPKARQYIDRDVLGKRRRRA